MRPINELISDLGPLRSWLEQKDPDEIVAPNMLTDSCIFTNFLRAQGHTEVSAGMTVVFWSFQDQRDDNATRWPLGKGPQELIRAFLGESHITASQILVRIAAIQRNPD
jgi:hypothetical protein